ncbi:MAG TPA: NUDIX domain-containing protein [Candidatus Limnocylindrales bacterium]|nr:NUDIX domain-containing protein [Candidatus Limnocylindrales bacterium]
MVVRRSAGILLFRRRDTASGGGLEVLLAHPGGPFFARRDAGHWTIPKGEPDDAMDDLLAVARREFAEETGHPAPAGQPGGEPPIPLGTIVQKGGKVVHGWAIEGDLDPVTSISNTFEMEWPPRSGRRRTFAEIDRVEWFAPDEARRRLKPTQVPFIDRLLELADADATDVAAVTAGPAVEPDRP